jgi:Tol biopolymer transport system component
MPPLTPSPNSELVDLVRTLHVMSLHGVNDQVIGINVWDYFLTPDDSKIVFYEQDRFIEEAYIFVVNSDGTNKYRIVEFIKRHAPIKGSLLAVSPTGGKIAFVNREGIAIVDLDGNNLVQLVKLPDGAPTDKISLEILEWQ